jgi:mediator of RNA polymerase II transcription subunit 13
VRDFRYGNHIPFLDILVDSSVEGHALAKKPSKDVNYVVYIVNPFTQGSATADICAAFLALFQKYAEGIDADQEVPNELVLQIIPLSFLTSSESPVVPAQSEYLKLALEVYDRCPPKSNGEEKTTSLIQCGPATILARPLPKSIDFQRVADTPSALLEERSCLHLAYAQSLDGRWITAAWTNTTGSFQTTLSYCLARKGYSMSRPLAEVLKDIWNTTCDIINAERKDCHLMLVKEGIMMEDEEIESMFYPSH